MDEKEFLRLLNKKAEEQQRVTDTELLPDWAKGLGEWLVINPWRVLAPASILIYFMMRMILGKRFRELILAIFGGFT